MPSLPIAVQKRKDKVLGKGGERGRIVTEWDGITVCKCLIMNYHNFTRHYSFIQQMSLFSFFPKNVSIDRKVLLGNECLL